MGLPSSQDNRLARLDRKWRWIQLTDQHGWLLLGRLGRPDGVRCFTVGWWRVAPIWFRSHHELAEHQVEELQAMQSRPTERLAAVEWAGLEIHRVREGQCSLLPQLCHAWRGHYAWCVFRQLVLDHRILARPQETRLQQSSVIQLGQSNHWLQTRRRGLPPRINWRVGRKDCKA